MGKLQKILLFFALPALLFSSCSQKAAVPSSPPQLVTGIQVLYRKNHTSFQRIYTDIGKIDTLLYYLYGLLPAGQAKEDPEQFALDSCKITLLLSDGETSVYRQRGVDYLSVNCHPWQKIDEKKGSKLLPLVENMPSDL